MVCSDDVRDGATVVVVDHDVVVVVVVVDLEGLGPPTTFFGHSCDLPTSIFPVCREKKSLKSPLCDGVRSS